MFNIGITGSIASGKPTVAKILASDQKKIFNADKVVKDIYKKKSFNELIKSKFKIKKKENLGNEIKILINKDKRNLKKIEKLVHPFVRSKMIKSLKNKKIKFFEIPLLIENKLDKYFSVIITVTAKKSSRVKRFKKRGGSQKIFTILEKRQLQIEKKINKSHFVIYNNSSYKNLKKRLINLKKIL